MMLKILMVMPIKNDCRNNPNNGPTSICIRLASSMESPISFTLVLPAMMPLESATTFWVRSNTAITISNVLLINQTEIMRIDGKVSYKDEEGKWVAVDDNTPVSMNVWGFTPDYFEYSEEYFKEFLSKPENMTNLKAEFFIPLMVNKLINEGTATVKVLDTTSKWFGVTYAADRQGTVDRIQKLIDEGVYPEKLFK